MRKPNKPGADQIPERDGDEEINRPLIGRHPRTRLAMLQIFKAFGSDQHQRHNFQRAENRADGQNARRRAAEIQVVHRAENAAAEINRGGKNHRGRGRGGSQQPHAREQEGDDDRGKHFKEAFDPEVNHPPAPVFGHGQVRLPSPHQTGTVKQSDGSGGEQEQAQADGGLGRDS